MKTKTAVLLCCVFYSAAATTQSLRYTPASPYIGLDAFSKKQLNVFSFTGNQAALAGVKHTGIGIYGERRFMLAETSSYCLVAAFPTRLGNIGIQLNYAGFKNFNESRIGLAYARSLGPKLDIGIQFNYYGYRVPVYGNASTFNFEAGAILHFTEQFHFGFHIYNPVPVKTGKMGREQLPAVYKAGLGYDAGDHFFIGSTVIKEEDQPVSITAVMQYRFSHVFFLRTGFISAQSMPFAGAGLGWKNMRLDISVSRHPQLGFSPGILLMMNFKNKKE